jgi:hypothetical protein
MHGQAPSTNLSATSRMQPALNAKGDISYRRTEPNCRRQAAATVGMSSSMSGRRSRAAASRTASGSGSWAPASR